MIIISIEEILAYLYREAEGLKNEIEKYKSQMDSAIPYGKEYWLNHDRYQNSFIRKTCFEELITYIEKA